MKIRIQFINNNKSIIERLRTEKEKSEKEIKRLNEQLIIKQKQSQNSNRNIYTTTSSTSIVEKYKQRNYSNNKDYINDKNGKELKDLTNRITKLQEEINSNKKTYNEKIYHLNEKIRQKEKEIKIIKEENDTLKRNKTNNNNNINIITTTSNIKERRINNNYSNNKKEEIKTSKKSFSQDKSSFNHTLRTITETSTRLPYIKPVSPSYRFYYRNNISKYDSEKISYLTECLQEKEEELIILNKCLEEKEKELLKYKEINLKKIKSNNTNIKIINNKEENKIYEQIEIYGEEIERKNKEILILKKRIKNLLIYLKRKDNNILILDNELKMYEKENEEIKIDNNNLINEKKKLEKINEILISKKENVLETGVEKCNKIILEQKKENEILKNRFDNLYKELNEYRKKNSQLSKELRKIKEEFNEYEY